MVTKATKQRMFIAILTAAWWQGQGQLTPRFDMVIAQDGSGDYTTITDGISNVPSYSASRFTIQLRAGIYDENFVIDKEKINLTIIGDGMETTIITGSKNYVDGVKTFQTATVEIHGEGFVASGITFQNTAGPEKDQAVALLTTASYSLCQKRISVLQGMRDLWHGGFYLW